MAKISAHFQNALVVFMKNRAKKTMNMKYHRKMKNMKLTKEMLNDRQISLSEYIQDSFPNQRFIDEDGKLNPAQWFIIKTTGKMLGLNGNQIRRVLDDVILNGIMSKKS